MAQSANFDVARIDTHASILKKNNHCLLKFGTLTPRFIDSVSAPILFETRSHVCLHRMFQFTGEFRMG